MHIGIIGHPHVVAKSTIDHPVPLVVDSSSVVKEFKLTPRPEIPEIHLIPFRDFHKPTNYIDGKTLPRRKHKRK